MSRTRVSGARIGLRIAAVVALTVLVASCGAGVGAEPREAAAGGSTVPDAYVAIPIDGGRAVARWNGQAAGYTLAKARAVLPGRFDSTGGGVFVYRAGSAPDGILRIRQNGGALKLSLRTESVNGHFEPVTGDFDGNGLTDILWYQPYGDPSYLWLFHADGSHTSRVFPMTNDAAYGVAIVPIDANLDGITDLLVEGNRTLWVMRADGSHTARNVALTDDPGLTTLVAGNLGPADGVTRRRMLAVYEGGLEHLVTFNAAGQSTGKQVRPHTGTCCVYQPAFGGHFRSGYAESLFFYSPGSKQPDYLQDVTPGGSLVTTATPQIGGTYAVSVGDFDGNGFDDLLLTNRNGATYLLSSDGSGFTQSDPANIAARTHVVAVPMG